MRVGEATAGERDRRGLAVVEWRNESRFKLMH